MRIVHLVAGAGGMYCGSCLQSNTLVAALREAGEDALLVPLYTPVRSDEQVVSVDRIALGGVNVYLQERFAWFRHAPSFLTGALDSPRLLRWLGNRGWGTRPEHLGPLCVSMLRGEQGHQRKELDKLVRWLRDAIRPQLVHLSSGLLIGMARMLGRGLDVPVVCSLSGEDAFLEKLSEPYYGQARAALGERSPELAALVTTNRYYADFMAEYLPVPRDRLHVVPLGLNLSGHGAQEAAGRQRDAAGRTATIGFLARVCPDKGLHLLAEAFRLLAADQDLPPTRLVAAGHLAPADRPYLAEIQSQIAAWGLADRFSYLGELDRAEKIAFLASLDVMSLPCVYRESRGLPVLEAWANAVPVVVPEHGAFPEMIADTEGGLLFEPGNVRELAERLRRLIADAAFALECGRRARQAVSLRYDASHMAQGMLELYRSVRDRR